MLFNLFFFVFFFFQAEDGIRDDLVTGVQTCALPILSKTVLQYIGIIKLIVFTPGLDFAPPEFSVGVKQIGRASCRERV